MLVFFLHPRTKIRTDEVSYTTMWYHRRGTGDASGRLLADHQLSERSAQSCPDNVLLKNNGESSEYAGTKYRADGKALTLRSDQRLEAVQRHDSSAPDVHVTPSRLRERGQPHRHDLPDWWHRGLHAVAYQIHIKWRTT